MDIAISIAAKVAEYTVAPVGRQLGYLIFYAKNIKDVKQKLENLVGAREKVQKMVDDAESNYCKILGDVSKWLANVDEIIQVSKMFEENGSESNKKGSNLCCFNLFQLHHLSRKAKKMVEEISEIMEKGRTFDKVGYHAPLLGIDSSAIPSYQFLESRMFTAQEIKDALANTNVNKVGVYGMGGVGKTMLIKEVERIVKEDKLFDQVIVATIGQSSDVKDIQKHIGDMLRLEFKQESEEGRAALLRNKLEMENKILIVLDDIWTELNLENIGIPCRSEGRKGCKILLTSRDRCVLSNEMNAQSFFEVKPLSKEESWEFFTNMIGDFDKTSIEPIAKEVAKQCAGLPIALATVAKALKGKTLPIWKDALKQLGNPIAVNIKGVSDKVYSSLKLSYDFIQSEEAKLLFFLCSVFPDDYHISMKMLQMYAMGLGLLNDVNTWEEAKNRTIKLVDDLKSSSLLLESNSKDIFGDNIMKMHDVIRDVAIYIASKEGRMATLSCGCGLSEWPERDRCGSYRAIFAGCHGFHNLAQNLKFPKLELLILSRHWMREKLQISDTFFEKMEELKVLHLSGMCFPQLTTSSTHSLANLRTLCISNCEFGDIDIIGELKKLEILRILGCRIRVLPVTMSRLIELKVLEVSDELKVIPLNVISSMKKLEVLDLFMSFNGWGNEVFYKDKLIKNAGLSELKCLPHLTALNLKILDGNILPALSFSEGLKLERFNIIIGSRLNKYSKFASSLRWVNLQVVLGTVVNDHVSKILLERCEELELEVTVGLTNVLFKPHGNVYPDLRRLTLHSNSDVRYLIGDQLENHCCRYFPCLDILSLDRMEILRKIVHMRVRANPFNKLRSIHVESCNKLRNLFSFSIFEGLSNLQEIQVSNCDMMDGIVCMETEEAIINTQSPLSSLTLYGVQQLTSFCSKQLTHEHLDNPIPFFDNQVPLLELKDLTIKGANNLKVLWRNNGLFASSFCRLRSIEIESCNNLRFIFPPNVVPALDSLDVIRIEKCKLLEAIFEEEELIVKEKDELQKLRYLYVKECPQLKSLLPASIKHLQQLEILDISGPHEMFSEDKTLEIAKSNLLFPQVVFPNLRSLLMTCNAMKSNFWVTQFARSELFPNLKHLSLSGSGGDKSITFPLRFSQILFSVEKLEVSVVSLVEVLFRNEENSHIERCANLKELRLYNLPDLTHVWKDDNTEMTVLFDNLEEISVGFCGNVKTLVLSSMGFPNLKSLTVCGLDGLMHLLNSSVAKSLVKLERMSIDYCNGITTIISGEGERDEIIFNSLVVLKLGNLPRLSTFYFGNCTLMFPRLEELIIDKCAEMKVFSHGIVSTPKLQLDHHMMLGRMSLIGT